MNWTQIEGKWEQLRGDVKARWAKLTDDDVKLIGGKFDVLVGKVMERYGAKKEFAQKEVNEWAERMRSRIEALGKPHGHGQAHPPR